MFATCASCLRTLLENESSQQRTVSHKRDEATHQAGEGQAMEKDESQDRSFAAVDSCCGCRDDDALGSDHLAHHASA